jgi:hypothetical protein
MSFKNSVSSLELGETVYVYELKEKEDGSFIIKKTVGVLDFKSKSTINQTGRVKVESDYGCYTIHIKGSSMTPNSNKVWTTTENNEKEVYNKFLEYSISRCNYYERMAEKQRSKQKLLKELLKE